MDVLNLPRADQLDMMNLILMRIAGGAPEPTEWETVRRIVQDGFADKFFSIGDQFIVNWKDRATETSYQAPLDVAHFLTVSTASKNNIPGMVLQWHYNTPFEIQFCNRRAFFYASAKLDPGDYSITVGSTDYQFTLSLEVPEGGQLSINEDANTVYSWASRTATTQVESVPLTVGSTGTKLTTLTAHEWNTSRYGYSRWKESAYRQWLNSELQNWWVPQSNLDRPSTESATKWGFLSGFDPEFLNILTPVKVTTATNNANDADALEDTYDRFFLPSKEEIFNTPQKSGEGVAWDYWKQRLGRTTPTANYPTTYPEYIKYNLNAQSTPALWRLRSANRGYSHYVWNVDSTGDVTYHHARYSYRSAPACIIC